MTIFLSHASEDKAYAARVARILAASGYPDIFMSSHWRSGPKLGADWESALYDAMRRSVGMVILCTRHWLASHWCLAEAILAREKGKRVLSIVDDEIDRRLEYPSVLMGIQGTRRGSVSDGELSEMIRGALGTAGFEYDFPMPVRPYLGLARFEFEDAGVLFGRDQAVRAVVEAVERRTRIRGQFPAFVLLVGASGSGKSSVLRAGALPRLVSHAYAKGERSDFVVATARKVPPGRFAFAEAVDASRGLVGLYEALERWTGRFTYVRARARESLVEMVRQEIARVSAMRTPIDESQREVDAAATFMERFATDLRNMCRAPEDAHVVITIDQVEAALRGGQHTHEALLVRALLAVARSAECRVITLAGIRSDYFEEFQRLPEARASYTSIPLEAPSQEDLIEAIERPAGVFGLHVESRLTQRLLEELGENDALPILSYALDQCHSALLAQRTRTQVISLEHFERHVGGVASAVSRHASATIERFRDDADTMQALRKAFHMLARFDRDDADSLQGRVLRHSIPRSLLPERSLAALDALTEARLVTASIDSSRQSTLVVTHESLFRAWPELRDWLREDMDLLRTRASIARTARQFLAAPEKVDPWPPARVFEFVDAFAGSGIDLFDGPDATQIRAFLGPVTAQDILGLLDATTPSSDSPFGPQWRTPLTHRARRDAGQRLDRLGDTRPGVGVRGDGLPDITWHTVRSGACDVAIVLEPMANNVATTATRIVQPVAPLRMAKYPVTVAQYLAFLQHEDYLTTWAPRMARHCFGSGQWPVPNPRTTHMNHPMTAINWFDAWMFCAWLDERLHLTGELAPNETLRLPTEFEWQLAACGGDPSSERGYPWGDADPNVEHWRSNIYENALQGGTAVGMYPAGAVTGHGPVDLVGTAYELCLNEFENPANVELPAYRDGKRRALRGGWWLLVRDVSRVRVRLAYAPEVRGADVSFRPCIATSIGSSHDKERI